jgi:hypothetical protein
LTLDFPPRYSIIALEAKDKEQDMVASDSTQKRRRLAPYVSAKVLSEFFDHIRYVREPSVIDSGLLQDYGISAASSYALLSTLKFLGLTDDEGKPTAAFRELQTGGDEFRDALRNILERSYSDLFSRLDVSRDTKDKIINFLARNYSPATAERAARLFLDLCGEAGIQTASQPRKAAATSKNGNASRQQQLRLNGQQEQQPQSNVETQVDQLPTPKVITQAESPTISVPRIDIRINSQDLVSMTPDQIAAIFEGLSKLSPATAKGEAQ